MNLTAFYDSLLAQNGGQWFDFEGVVRSIYREILRPGDTAVDVGAHKGAHTFQMLECVAPSGFVIAVEASAEMVGVLIETMVQYYSHCAGSLTLHSCAVSDREGEMEFFYAPDAPGMSSASEIHAANQSRTDRRLMPSHTLDSLLTGHYQGGPAQKHQFGPVKFLKLDIEGGEYHALLGAQKMIRRDKPVICFEHGRDAAPGFGYTLTDFSRLWTDLGYEVFDLFGNPQGDAWHNSRVWDFAAIPREYDATRIWNAVARGLEGIVRYEVPLPLPQPPRGSTKQSD